MESLDFRHANDVGVPDPKALDRLGSLCAMEASAVRSYENALTSPLLQPYRHALLALRGSHEECMRLLDERLRLAGGQASSTPKISDSLVAFLEDMGVALGASTAFSAFDRGETHCSNEYRRALSDFDGATRDFVEREILPRQISAHALVSTIRRES